MANFPIENRVKLTYYYGEVIIVSEFCVDCWNELNGTEDPKEAYVLSWKLELCEGCGEWKRVVVIPRRHWLLRYWLMEGLRKIRKK